MPPASNSQPNVQARWQITNALIAQAEDDYRRSIDLFDKLARRVARATERSAVLMPMRSGSSGWGWYLNDAFTDSAKPSPTSRRAIELWRAVCSVTRASRDARLAHSPELQLECRSQRPCSRWWTRFMPWPGCLDDTGRAPKADDQRRQLEDDTAFVAKRFAGPDYQETAPILGLPTS